MDQHEKRSAPRVTCSIGLQLQGQWTMVRARVEDVGRLGARLRVPLKELGLQPDAGMTAVAAHIRQLLTHDVVANLRPEMLGSLVQRHVLAVRVAPTQAGDDHVDIGCEFDRPLTRLDAVALGLPIPMEGESLEEALAGVSGRAPVTREVASTAAQSADCSPFADLRFSLLVRKADLGAEPGNGAADSHRT